ncbi:protein DMP2 [Brachypodium distachyon]|uniref:Uncharacterized protein n=1 Tax=Brachypodium distachyon TaxID=15368 RepID=I1I7H4_BRADI|nr:protein DMP2 [Brachypodium distachyon]KQJ98486.1 hypothetical protein BRADI_3g37160v3 [Brachypodium distachyon]|eukprot:XP_003572244.1 protein DMP2 [Brachypodium distachyon]
MAGSGDAKAKDDQHRTEDPAAASASTGTAKDGSTNNGNNNSSNLYDKTLSAASNLARLLPTGTTTAFQTLAPSFTNHGECYPVNRYFTWALILFLGVLCSFLSFTDSVTDESGHTYYGVALPLHCRRWGGFMPFNHDEPIDERERNKRAVRTRDWLHSFFRFVVFISLAFCDSGVQKCLVPLEKPQWREFLVNMPLASGFLASFVFMIIPSTRHGIGAGPGDRTSSIDAAAAAATTTSAAASGSEPPNGALVGPDTGTSRRVAPTTGCELCHV